MEGGEFRVAFLEGEGAEGKAESDVVEGVGFGGGGCLSVGNGDLDLLGHGVILSCVHKEEWLYSSCICLLQRLYR